MDDEQNQVLDFDQAYAGMQGLTGSEALLLETNGGQSGVEGTPTDIVADGNGDVLQQQQQLDTNTLPLETQQQETVPVAPQVDTQTETIKMLMERNQQLQNALLAQQPAQQSATQQQPVQEQPAEPPLPDWDPIYDDEATIAQKKQAYALKSAEFSAAQIMKQLGPTLQYAENARISQERASALQELSTIPELQGIASVQPRLDSIIANNKYLQGMPINEAYANAYTMMKGFESIRQQNNQPQPAVQVPPQTTPQPQQQINPGDLSSQMTPEQLMEFYRGNPQFQQMVEQERITRLQGGQQVPTHSASGGAAAAALNVPKKPTSFDEAKSFFNGLQ